ncbi:MULTISPECIES: dipeptidase [unclassified Sphingomonas]|uniref:dipeptidase n=1 Tax=unclassified Sphingomonas TaxID=196159 RepID=UPI0006FA47F0|nr:MULTISPECIES: dipeptidase [unclassified Sphingomonas]KQN21634.1 membrane dipeptidase [Sphingomonas sp. Leaf30]MBD8551311.1 dipeptidase [Sphingomonas sp. CFBP 8764]
MITALLLIAAQASAAPVAPDPRVAASVDRVLRKTPIIDGHNDLAWEIRDVHCAKVESLDLAADTRPLQTDIPRLRKGRVGAQFWSVWIPADMTGPRAVEMTLEQIDIVHRFVAANPAALERATSAADIRRIEKAGRIASLIGVEGGHQIDGRLSVLRQYRALGVGYMTLTHGKSLNWADSSTDVPRANGLTDFGRAVVAEMNRIGMIVDVSHVSDATMRAVLAAARAPVMASHSSARALTDAPRDIPDDLLAAVGANGGIVMVNFYPAFVSTAWRAWDADRTAFAKTAGVPANVYGARSPAPLVAWDRDHPEPRVTAATVANHVEHIARVAGRDHVGLGGDYDGINGTGPEGMTGVDGYPLLFAELARRGWTDADMARLAGGNMLRVMDATDAVARSLSALPPGDAIDIASR